ncbi:MAG: hypothetical protein Q8O25_15655 [Sulfurisoma sp.]|nr:hypothetical protein [Sulfurisoma sp.]
MDDKIGRRGPGHPPDQPRSRLPSIDEAHSRLTPDSLTATALLYIALPNLIFLGGWLRPELAVIAIGLLLASLWQFLRRRDMAWALPQSAGALLLIVLVAFAWTSLGGAGHFFRANLDWLVRDTVLGDLTLTDWPPSYGMVDGNHHILRSAIGFFLPAALLGKLAGMGVVDIALYFWTALGAALFLLLLPLPQRAGSLLGPLLLVPVFFSGMDYLGIVLVTGTTPVFPLRLEWWVPFSYSSLTGQMYWAPNHALPLWLVTALFYRHWGHRCLPALVTLLLPMLVIWTPFAVVGILPFVGLAILRWFAEGRTVKEWNLSVVQILAAVLLTYLTVRLMTLGIAAIPGAPTANVAPNADRFVLKYLTFVLMEFAILALLMARQLRHSHGLFWLSFAILAALPLYQYGPSNDTALRLSTPALVILMILLIDQIRYWATLKSWRAPPPTAWAIAVVLPIGACTPFNEMWRAATFSRTPPNYKNSLVDQHKGQEPPHYVGRLDRADLIAVLRTPTLVPNAAERSRQGLPVAPPPLKPR